MQKEFYPFVSITLLGFGTEIDRDQLQAPLMYYTKEPDQFKWNCRAKCKPLQGTISRTVRKSGLACEVLVLY